MKIYFACSITGGREDEGVYQRLVKALTEAGHDVPTAHIAESGVEERDQWEDPLDIYRRDVTWIEESDLLVAEVSTPSHGVGYEIGYALSLRKPVLCLYHADKDISKMISGNPHPLLSVHEYQTHQEALEVLSRFLSEISTGDG
ncbi:MAG: nucleoside 2-deoxyribosyltransferase [Anaerolineales bacterium]